MSGLRTTFVTGYLIVAGCFPISTRAQTSPATEPKMTIACQIRVTSQNDMLRLEAVANGRETATGTYRLDVLKQSPSGTSQNVQSGAFELNADRDAILTTIVLDGSARGHYRARLTLDTKEFGTVSCVSP